MTDAVRHLHRFTTHFSRFKSVARVVRLLIADTETSLPKEIKMSKSITTSALAMTMCIAATLSYNAAGASAGSPSSGQPATNASHNYVVRFNDVDLSKIDGAVVLYARIREAAGTVCRPLESRQLGFAQKHRVCMDRAISDAVASVNRPLLSQYHQLRTKGDRVGIVQLATAN
jgi:UrcA family protein